MRRYALNSSMPVLLRPDNRVQVGWDPRRAVLVHPPEGMTAASLAELLRGMQAGMTISDLQTDASRRGATDADAIADLVASLVSAGVATNTSHRRSRSASIRIHGRGPLSDLLANALRCSGARVAHSSLSHAAAPETTDLVVLSDFLIADPRVVRDLQSAGIAHLPVRVRDGTGLVGPLVIPGVTSCLACADLHRTDRDAAWPAVAAQLRDTVGTANRATVLATAALALNQVDRIIRAVGDSGGLDGCEPPQTLDTTLEFDINTGSAVARRWSRHPQCSC
jgi:bacteriocin biosynthesis cyclodehydratase domain-containing protein